MTISACDRSPWIGRVLAVVLGLALGLALLAWSGGAVMAQDAGLTVGGVVASPADAQRRMVALAQSGQWAEAETLARAVLQTDPDNVAALVVLARARLAAGDARQARATALRANAVASNPAERYLAAVELASASHALGRPMEAQFWMRRAAQMAPTDESHDRALADVRRIGAAMPWQVSLQFNVAQSSNVNNGSLVDSVDIGGLAFTLNPSARALSGTEITAGVLARYRFSGVGDLPGLFTLNAATRQVILSDDAQDKAPTARSGDYAFGVVELGLGQALNPRSAPLRFRVDGQLGKTWYGGDDLSRYLRLTGRAEWGDPKRAVNGVSLSVERQNRLDDPLKSAWITQAGVQTRRRIASGDTFGLSFGLRRTQSDSVEIDHDAVLAGATWDMGKPLGDMVSLGLGLSVERRSYDASTYGPQSRTDLQQRATLRVGLPKVDYYGFSPVIRLESERIRSNIDFYDRSDMTLNLGLKSVF